MSSPRYTFNNLERHTNSIRLGARKIIRKHRSFLNQAFSDFSKHLDEIEQQPPSLQRNVKLMLACKVFNHVYSGIILIESGLTVDAIICERSALESIAFHWLVCVDPTAAGEYETEKVPRPVEVRRRLEKLGVDISQLREMYSFDSEFTHVGRSSERFDNQLESSLKGSVLFGGSGSLIDQDHMIKFLPHFLYLFPEPLMKQAHPT
ncbi:MAG: hypothetical protein P4L51_20575 [Puia sp.]|nr:hypothetical protein [Puia sp.]